MIRCARSVAPVPTANRVTSIPGPAVPIPANALRKSRISSNPVCLSVTVFIDRNAPDPANTKTSAASPPESTSAPSPPARVSRAMPPSRMSLPPRPFGLSFPLPPRNSLLPLLPISVLLSSDPCAVSTDTKPSPAAWPTVPPEPRFRTTLSLPD